jgi:hypothetical protein
MSQVSMQHDPGKHADKPPQVPGVDTKPVKFVALQVIEQRQTPDNPGKPCNQINRIEPIVDQPLQTALSWCIQDDPGDLSLSAAEFRQ